MIKACIFDLDGVIIDTAKYHFLAWQRLAKELGFEFTLEQNERLKGVSRMRSLEILLEVGGLKMGEKEMEILARRKNEWFVEYINTIKPDDVYPGVKELVKKIKAMGLKVGLASSSKNAGTVIRLIGMEMEFDSMVDGNMIKNTKPDPEIFLLAAAKLKTVPSQCLVFEDAEAGVEAALNAGMKAVGIGSLSQLGKASAVIPRTGDFKLELLDTL